MSFCTVINCMDGRVQLPVIDYLQKKFGVKYVDSITEAGPNLVLAEKTDSPAVEAILRKVSISVEKHKSIAIAVVGHFDCAGNPVSEDIQNEHTRKAVRFVRQQYGSIPVIGLWVDNSWEVQEVNCD